MINTFEPVIEKWSNPKGSTALVVWNFIPNTNYGMKIHGYVTNNTRIRSLKSFNHTHGVICQYNEKNWKQELEKYIREDYND